MGLETDLLAPMARRSLTQEASLRIQRGDPMDGILEHLRSQGASKIDTIVVLRCSTAMGLEEAKRIVHFSSAWKDAKERDERMWDELEAGLKEADAAEPP